MSPLDMETLLQPLQPDQPCGPNLQYDAPMIALEQAIQGKPEQQYGETIIPAEPPDWKEVRRLGLELLKRTKDLRVACYLARALLELEGLAGFAACLQLVRGYVEQYWEGVHPRLDPDDDNDPTERVNIVAALADKSTTVEQLLDAQLVRTAPLGAISMHDVRRARGDLPTLADQQPIDLAVIEGSFMDCDVEQLQQTLSTVEQALVDAAAIEGAVTQHVGAANAVSMEGLTDSLQSIRDYVDRHVQRRQAGAATGDEGDAAPSAAQPDGGAAPAAVAAPLTGEIRSRDDAIRAIDKICAYYDRSEPSSPVPLLLKRARRLATMNFLDILQDMTPEGVSQARLIGGVDSTEE